MEKAVKRPAAKSESLNKSQAIRDKRAELGKNARPRDIIAALKQEGVHVSAALVTNVITRSRTAHHPAKGRRGVMVAIDGHVSLTALMEAKRFVKRCGSISAARAALEALAKLV